MIGLGTILLILLLLALAFGWQAVPREPTPCLIDPALPLSRNGYARRYYRSPGGGRYYHAHRAALAQALGRDLAPTEHAAHACHTKACYRVGPEHVHLATAAQNEAEKYGGGRAPVGARHPRAKLTPADVAAARATCARVRPGAHNGLYRLAARLGVAPRTLRAAVTGATWRTEATP